MRTFDNNKGYRIIDVAHRHQPIGLGFRDLQRKTSFSSRKTLELWLKRLRNLGIIKLYPKIPIRLTEVAAESYKNRSLVLPSDFRSRAILKSPMVRNKKTNHGPERSQNIYLLILSIAVFGATYYRCTTKFEPGQISIKDIFKNKKISYSSYERPGVGLVDLVDKQRTKSDYLPPRRKNIGNGELFGYISITKSEAQQSLNMLQDHNPPILHIIEHKSNDKSRYGLLNPLLKEFVSYCIRTLHDVEWRMQYVWLYKRPIKECVEDDEKKWFMRLYGDKAKMGRIVSSHFLNLVEMKCKLRGKEKKRIQQLNTHADKTIREFDESIKRSYQVILSQKYRSLRNTYSLVTDPLLEVVYPQFLRSELNLY
jgi:hypothetical protein